MTIYEQKTPFATFSADNVQLSRVPVIDYNK